MSNSCSIVIVSNGNIHFGANDIVQVYVFGVGVGPEIQEDIPDKNVKDIMMGGNDKPLQIKTDLSRGNY